MGASHTVNYPGALATSVYGPDNLAGNDIRLVGGYRNPDYATAPVEVHGFLLEGTAADLANVGNYFASDYPGAKYNYVHSTMGGLVVGNYDSPAAHGTHSLPLGPGHAYIYDIASDTFLTDVVFPGSLSHAAYGIWYNDGTSYTIVGGHSLDPVNNFADQNLPIGKAYLADYDSATGLFTHWKSFEYPNGTNFVTHFEGIGSVEKGVYTLNADSAQAGTTDPAQGSWVSVRRNTDGSFSDAAWVDLNYEDLDPTTYVTSSNSVYGNQVVGVVFGGGTDFSFQATVNTGFPINLIANNIADGVLVASGTGNGILRNSIYSNTLLGIDLAPGANLNQAAPVLTSVQTLSLGIQVTGTLTSLPNTNFRIEFFANSTGAPAGRYFLGSQQVTTSSTGGAAFTFLGPLLPTGANFITATATDPQDNTSEFSAVAS